MADQSVQLKDLGRELKLTFPPTVHLSGVVRDNGMDDLVRVKILMTKAEWDIFLSQSPIRLEEMQLARPDILGKDEGFWDPNQAKHLRIGEVQRPGARYLSIAFDDSDPSKVPVYIMEHGT
jgi:hypothetical protein